MHLGELILRGTALALVVCLAGCQSKAAPIKSDKLKVVATTGMLGDLVENVCGDHCEVTTLMGPGVDPHLYKPTAGDVLKIEEADLVFHGGLHLEGRMTEIFEQLGEREYASEAAISKADVILHEGQPDPHIWHDPNIWFQVSGGLASKLIQLRPEWESDITKNQGEYGLQLKLLDEDIREQLTAIPKNQRILVTAHDAFEYFGKQYDMQVLGIQGTNTQTEASAQGIVKLADTIAEKRIGAIFVESSVNPATVRALQKAVRERGWQVRIGGELYSDAMGEAGTDDGTYLGMIRHNTNTISNGLKSR